MKNNQAIISIVIIGLLMISPFILYEYNIISKSVGLVMQGISIILAGISIFYSNYKYDKRNEK